MRILHPTVAVAALLLVESATTHARDLLRPDRPIAQVVDHYIEAGLTKAGVMPVAAADDATLVRRVTLDLAGHIPIAAETRAYVESTDRDKLTRLVDRLMASPAFVRHQATELDTMLMAGAGSKGGLRDYLVQAVGENRPWDRIFRELMLPDQNDKVQKVAACISVKGSRISIGSPPTSARRSSASISVARSVTTTLWFTTGNRSISME